MISAEKAREIQRAAQNEQNAYVRAVIVREVEDICEVIAMAARGRNNSWYFDASHLDYPKGVTEYLRTELGFTAKYSNSTISVSW